MHQELCAKERNNKINGGRQGEAQVHMGTVIVMLFVELVPVVWRMIHKLVCVVVINGVSVGVLLVGHMRSLCHSDHQGVIENKQKSYDEFLVHAIDLSCQLVETVAV